MRKKFKSLVALLSAFTLTCGAAMAVTACTNNEPAPDPDPGNGNVTPVTYSVTISSGEHGTVTSDKNVYNGGDTVTLTITPDSGYELAALIVDGADKKSEVVNDKLQVTINADMTVSATFLEIGPMDAEISIAEGCQMTGMTLTLKTAGKDDQTVTVGDDNSFSLTDVPYGTVYSVTGKVGGLEVDLGSFTVKSATTAYDPSAAFNMSGTAANFAEGSFDYKYNGVIGGWEFTDLGDNIADGDAYVAAKISISEEDMNKLRADGEAVFGISMTVGGQTDWVDIWLKGEDLENGNVYGMLANEWSEGGVFLKGGKLTDYGKALTSDGFWLVAHYERATGLFKSWVGASVDNIVYQRDWGTTEAKGFNFASNSKMTGFGVGKHSPWGNNVEVDVKFSDVRYGSSLGEALGITEDVVISDDSTYEHGKVQISGKPYGNVTLTFTPDDGYYLKSVKINGEEKTVSEGTLTLESYPKSSVKVEATFEEVAEISGVEITVSEKVKMDGMTLTLTKDGQATTVTVEDGKFTLTDVTVGDEYDVTATVNGIKTSLGKLRIAQENNVFDPTATLGGGNGGTLDLVNGNYTYKSGEKGGYTFSVQEETTGDVWIATKIVAKDLDKIIAEKSEAVFGISLKIGDITRAMHIRIYQGNDYKVLAGDWTEDIVLDSTGYADALKGDGLYFIAHYSSSDGLLETWIGTSPQSVKKLRDWGAAGERGFNANEKLVSFGVGYLHDWGQTAPMDVTFSGVSYGATLNEALGIEA